MKAKDGKTLLHAVSFKAPKIRLLRSLAIEGSPSMQVKHSCAQHVMVWFMLNSLCRDFHCQNFPRLCILQCI